MQTRRVFDRAAAAVLAALTLAPAAASEADEASFGDVSRIDVRGFAGSLEIAVDPKSQAGRADIYRKKHSDRFRYDVTTADGALVVSGLDPTPADYGRNWRRRGDAFAELLADYPHVKIVVGPGTALRVDDSVVIVKGGDLGGDLAISGGDVRALFGDVASAELRLTGAQDMSVGAVEGVFALTIQGSGEVSARSAGTVRIEITGSGDVDVGPVTGDANAMIAGSGDIRLRRVGGALDARVAGSGDISTGDVALGARLSLAGSGDIAVGSVAGPLTAEIGGTGDIGVRGGTAEPLEILIGGTGDFVFGGVATSVRATIGGTGGAFVKTSDGPVTFNGYGVLTVGDATYGGRDDRRSGRRH